MQFKNKPVFSLYEIAEILDVPEYVVEDLIDDGYLRAIQLVGNHITRASFLEFLDEYDGTDIEAELY